jgi:hypothetical protein
MEDLLTSFHPRVQRMHIELGLEDPAETGQAWALLGPLSGWLMYRFGGSVRLEPNFTAPTFAVEGKMHFTLIPLQTLGIALGFASSPSILRNLYGAHRARL